MTKRSLVLRFGVGTLILGVIAFQIDWAELVSVFRNLQPLWLIPVVLLYTADRLIMAGKWKYLLHSFNVDIKFIEAVTHYYTGGIVGLATQWQSIGDIARIAEAGRSTGKYGAVSTSVVLEKLAGLNALSLLAVVSGLLLNQKLQIVGANAAMLLATVLLVVLVIAPFVTVQLLPAEWVGQLLQKAPISRISSIGARISEFDGKEALQGVYPRFFGLTLAEQFMPIVGLALIGQSLALSMSLSTIFAFLPVAMLIARIPISVEAIGVREGLYVFLLSAFGYNASTAFALAVATRIVDVAVVGIGVIVINVVWSGEVLDETPSYSSRATTTE